MNALKHIGSLGVPRLTPEFASGGSRVALSLQVLARITALWAFRFNRSRKLRQSLLNKITRVL